MRKIQMVGDSYSIQLSGRECDLLKNVLKCEEREGVMLPQKADPGLCWASDRRVGQRRRYAGETPWLTFRRKGVSDRRNPRHDTGRERRG